MDHGYTYVNAQLDIFYLPEAHEMMSLKDKMLFRKGRDEENVDECPDSGGFRLQGEMKVTKTRTSPALCRAMAYSGIYVSQVPSYGSCDLL